MCMCAWLLRACVREWERERESVSKLQAGVFRNARVCVYSCVSVFFLCTLAIVLVCASRQPCAALRNNCKHTHANADREIKNKHSNAWRYARHLVQLVDKFGIAQAQPARFKYQIVSSRWFRYSLHAITTCMPSQHAQTHHRERSYRRTLTMQQCIIDDQWGR